MFGLEESGGIDLGTAFSGAGDTLFGAINDVLPIAVPIGVAVLGVFLGWRLLKRVAKG